MGGLASLGSFAGGLAQGVERGQGLVARQKQMALADSEQAYIQKKRKREDAGIEAMDAASAAAQGKLQEIAQSKQAEIDAQYSKQQPGPTLDGGPVATNPAPKYKPNDYDLLEASQAYTDELFKRNKFEEGVKSYAVSEGQRARLRGNAVQKFNAALAMGGDITGPMKEVSTLFDNGMDVVKAEPTQAPDGSQAYAVTMKNRLTGEPLPPKVMTTQEMQMNLAVLTGDPKDVAKLSFETYMANLKSALEMRQDAEKSKLRLGEEGEKYKLRLGEISASGREQRRTKATPDYGDNNFTLGEGQTRFSLDGSGNPVPVASGKPKSKSGDVKWTDLAAEHYGDPPMGLSGKRVAGPRTMAISTAAQRIYEANKDKPGMTPEVAIQLAAKVHKIDK